jgi:hypothetical protein
MRKHPKKRRQQFLYRTIFLTFIWRRSPIAYSGIKRVVAVSILGSTQHDTRTPPPRQHDPRIIVLIPFLAEDGSTWSSSNSYTNSCLLASRYLEAKGRFRQNFTIECCCTDSYNLRRTLLLCQLANFEGAWWSCHGNLMRWRGRQ